MDNEKPMTYASYWERGMALLLDEIILTFPLLIISLFRPFDLSLTITFLISELILSFIYYIYFHGKFGQTPGKRVLSIKVLKNNGDEINYFDAVLRSSVDIALGIGFHIVLFILMISLNLKIFHMSDIYTYGMSESIAFMVFAFGAILWFIFEVLTVLMNERNKAIHDYIASTVVISQKERPGGFVKKFLRLVYLIVLIAMSVFFYITEDYSGKNQMNQLAQENNKIKIDAYIESVKDNKFLLNRLSLLKKNALHHAIEEKNNYFAKELIKRGIAINVQDIDGNSPLHIAVSKSNFIIAKLLIKNKANLYLKNKNDEKPCDVFAYGDSGEIKKYIMSIKKIKCKKDFE